LVRYFAFEELQLTNKRKAIALSGGGPGAENWVEARASLREQSRACMVSAIRNWLPRGGIADALDQVLVSNIVQVQVLSRGTIQDIRQKPRIPKKSFISAFPACFDVRQLRPASVNFSPVSGH